MRAKGVASVVSASSPRSPASTSHRRLDAGAVLVDGQSLRLDACDSLGLRHGVYEPYERRLLQSLIAPGTTVIDVGANIGLYTLLFARTAGEEGRVYAFEPEPENLRLLAHNVRTNGCTNVTILPKAVAARTGVARLFLSADNRGDHRLFDPGDGRLAIPVPTVALDEAFAGHDGPIALVKIDIQGAEVEALSGMRVLLDRHSETWVALEYWPAGLRRAGASGEGLLDALAALDRLVFRIDESRQAVVPLDREWLAHRVTEAKGNHTNLLVAPRWGERGAAWERAVAPGPRGRRSR